MTGIWFFIIPYFTQKLSGYENDYKADFKLFVDAFTHNTSPFPVGTMQLNTDIENIVNTQNKILSYLFFALNNQLDLYLNSDYCSAIARVGALEQFLRVAASFSDDLLSKANSLEKYVGSNNPTVRNLRYELLMRATGALYVAEVTMDWLNFVPPAPSLNRPGAAP